ncbi:MAG: hypothetical protein WBZ36_06115 [Candidatus Nitrosopolaris sp.]
MEDVDVAVCPKFKEELAQMIGEEVWNVHGDIRDVISISKLIRKNDGPQEIAAIMGL